jgi:hypothetical protein
MPGLFDRLNAKLVNEQPSGITALDITDLPHEQKQVMLSLLRDQGGALDGVTLDSLTVKFGDKLNDLDATLFELAHKGWLIVLGEAPNLRYRVNLRAKRGSHSSFGLWSVLSDRISKDMTGSGK